MAETETAPPVANVVETHDDRALRQRIMKKVNIERPLRVDIRPVGTNRYRVNVWAETGSSTENGWAVNSHIAQSFYHMD